MLIRVANRGNRPPTNGKPGTTEVGRAFEVG